MDPRELGSFLELLRGSRSLRGAARDSGLSHAYIRDLELGHNRSTGEFITPSPDTLLKLASAYNHPYEDLMIRAGHWSRNSATIPMSLLRNILQHVELSEAPLPDWYPQLFQLVSKG